MFIQIIKNIKTLYYDRTDCFVRVKINKTSASRRCNICHCWYSLNKRFKFQSDACNRCHNLLMMSMNLSDIYILNIKNANYCCIINGITKSEAI